MSGFLSPSIYGKRFSQNGLVPIGHLLAPYLTVTKNSALSQMIDVPKLVLGRGMMSRRRVWGPALWASIGFEVVNLCPFRHLR